MNGLHPYNCQGYCGCRGCTSRSISQGTKGQVSIPSGVRQVRRASLTS